MILGRVIPNDPVDIKDKGIFAGNAGHPGWTVPYCEYHTDQYFYYQKQQASIGCNSSSDYWHVAAGPSTAYMPSFGMIFAGADLVSNTQTFVMTKNFGTSNSSPDDFWTLQVFMERCRPHGCTSLVFTNRSYLNLLFKTRARYLIRICEPGGPIVTRFFNTEIQAEYWSDPWTTIDGIGGTFYLKDLTHVQALYYPCDIAEGYWNKSICLKSYEKGTLTDYPINIVPTSITLDRLS